MPYKFEIDLQSRIISQINERYGPRVWVFKAHDLVRVGVPDLIICLGGHFVAIELKRGRNRHRKNAAKRSQEDEGASMLQLYNVKKINLAGGSAFVGREVTVILERLDKIYRSLTI